MLVSRFGRPSTAHQVSMPPTSAREMQPLETFVRMLVILAQEPLDLGVVYRRPRCAAFTLVLARLAASEQEKLEQLNRAARVWHLVGRRLPIGGHEIRHAQHKRA